MEGFTRVRDEESGTEMIEFLGLLPLLLMVGVIIVQLFLAGQSILLGVGAAREGARAAAVCGNVDEAVSRAMGSYINHFTINESNGDEAIVTVEFEVPTILHSIFGYKGALLRPPPIRFTSKMRIEKTRCYNLNY